MDEQTGGFRSAWFGFRREDVVKYIEQTDSKYHTETEELRRQLTEAQAALEGITYSTPTTTGSAEADPTGNYQYIKSFATEQEAISWCNTKLNISED